MIPAMSRRFVAAALAAALLAAVGALVYQVRIITRQGADRARLIGENRLLREQLRKTGATAPAAAMPSAAPEPEQSGAVRKWPAGNHANELIAARLDVARLQKELTNARSAMEQTNARVAALQEEASRAASENDKRLAAAEAQWKETLETTNLNMESLRADLRQAKQDTAQLQTANVNLKNAGAQSAAQVADATRLFSQWQEVSRRRDTYLNDVLQRYRDVTRSYRSMVGILNGRRNDQPGQVVDDAELGRIQSAITSAEEDMRQIDSLNAQAALIQRKLAKR